MRQPPYRLQIVFLGSGDIKIISKCFISRLSYTPVSENDWGNRGTRQPQLIFESRSSYIPAVKNAWAAKHESRNPKFYLKKIYIVAVVFRGYRQKNEVPPNTRDYTVPS